MIRFEKRRDPELADVPVAILTATIDPAEESRRMGALAGFQKPLDVHAVLELVARYCPKRD